MKAWKQLEADAGALFGAKRCWANSGERCDFIGATAVGQCKLVKTMSLEALTQLAEEMDAEGNRTNKLGVVVAKVRRGRGQKSPMLVVMTAEQFDQWFSMRSRQTQATEAGR